MAIVFFTLSLILGFVSILGLISPKLILRNSAHPKRSKVLLLLGLPSFILFVAFGFTYESSWDAALKDKENVLEVSLKYMNLTELPEELSTMKQLVKLDLSKNNLTELPNYLRDFNKLEELNLSDNPISELPVWLTDLKSLKRLTLDRTDIIAIPVGLESAEVSYKETPLYQIEHPVLEEAKEKPELAEEKMQEDDHSESFGEFAMRKFMGRDYGSRRKFEKGEIFYEQPVTKDQVDQIGEFMLLLGVFNDENESSMLLELDEDIYKLKMVVNEDSELNADLIAAFTTIKSAIQLDVFPNDKFQLILTDDRLDPIKVIQ